MFIYQLPELPSSQISALLRLCLEELERRGISVCMHVPSGCGFVQTPRPTQAVNLKETLRAAGAKSQIRIHVLRHVDIYDAERMSLIEVFSRPEIPRLRPYIQLPVEKPHLSDAWAEWDRIFESTLLPEQLVERERERERKQAAQSMAPDAPDLSYKAVDLSDAEEDETEEGEPVAIEPSAVMTKEVITSIAALAPALCRQPLEELQGRFMDWSHDERRFLGVLPEALVHRKIEELTQKMNCNTWSLFGPPVTVVDVVANPRMSLERQLEWLLFRLDKAKEMISKDVSCYPKFFWYFLPMSPVKARFRNIRRRAEDLWAMWTGESLPSPLPEVVQAQLDLMRPGRHACISCQRFITPSVENLVACADCTPFVCLQHKVLKVAKPEGLCEVYIGSMQQTHYVTARILKMQRLLAVREFVEAEDDTAEESLVAQCQLEMRRDGCCYGGLCHKHAEAHEILSHIDKMRSYVCECAEAPRFFPRRKRPFDGAPEPSNRREEHGIWRHIESHLELLHGTFSKATRKPQYVCTTCFPDYAEWLAEDANLAAADAAPMSGPYTAAFVKSYMEASESGFVGSIKDFDPERFAAERRKRWLSLSAEERELRWCPIPGAFIMPMKRGLLGGSLWRP